MTTTLIAAADSWLALNDPSHAENLARFHAMNRFAVLGAEPGRVVSKTALVGDDRDTVLRNSQQLKGLLGQPDGADHFADCPMDGCTSIMNMARVAAGFNPALMGVGNDPQKQAETDALNLTTYNDYVTRLLKAPFFNLDMNDAKSLSKQSSDWSALIEQIAGLFEGVQKEDFESIRKSLVALASTAVSHQGTAQTANLFTQSVLGASNDGKTLNYTVNIYSSHVSMISSTDKGATTTQSDFQIRRTKLTFRVNEWPQFAAKVWAKQVTTVDDWLSTNDTPKGNTPTDKVCLK